MCIMADTGNKCQVITEREQLQKVSSKSEQNHEPQIVIYYIRLVDLQQQQQKKEGRKIIYFVQTMDWGFKPISFKYE